MGERLFDYNSNFDYYLGPERMNNVNYSIKHIRKLI